MCETAAPGARYRSGVYAGWRRHVELLLASCDVDDPGLRADFLLAALGAELHAYLSRGSPARAGVIRQTVHYLADCLAVLSPGNGARRGQRS